MNDTDLYKRHKQDIGALIYELVNTGIKLAPTHIKAFPQDCYIYLPSFLHGYFADYLYKLHIHAHEGPERVINYKGYSVLPGYENKVVIAHKDCVLHPGDSLKIEVKIP